MPESGSEARHLTGKCLCGQLEYEVADAFVYAMYCHCSLCRRATGSAFKALAGIESGKIRITRGDEAVQRWGGDVWYNVHCRSCGSLVYAVVRDGAFVHVAMGTLMDAPSIRPTRHIFVGSKAPWYEITDALPQHEGFPPS